jgi:hypothetical protein
MTRLRWTGWALAILLAGCGGTGNGGGGTTSSGGATQSPLHFTVRTGTGDSTAYPCSSGSGVATKGTPTGLMIACGETNASGATVSDAIIGLAGYHGAGTYTFTGSTDTGASFVQLTLDNYDFVTSVGATPGEPQPSCSVQITSAPATLSIGDEVSGSFHCDNIVGLVITGDGSYNAPVFTTADGEFDGPVVF